MSTTDTALRLWRARRRHAHIDATLCGCGAEWEVSYSRNDRPLVSRRFATEADARADAAARFSELQRAGWIDHW